MDIRELKYFCAVASEGSLSKAAQKLHYAQSNLSTKIMQLEQEIGCPLLVFPQGCSYRRILECWMRG